MLCAGQGVICPAGDSVRMLLGPGFSLGHTLLVFAALSIVLSRVFSAMYYGFTLFISGNFVSAIHLESDPSLEC